MITLNWRTIAVDKLKDYRAKKIGSENLEDEIQELEYRRRSIRSATGDGTPVKGGGSGREDVLLSSIVLQDEKTEALSATNRWVERVERGLAVLTTEERTILDRFYILPEKGAAERLAMDLGVDVKTVYHRKDRALRKFTIAMCGCVDS